MFVILPSVANRIKMHHWSVFLLLLLVGEVHFSLNVIKRTYRLFIMFCAMPTFTITNDTQQQQPTHTHKENDKNTIIVYRVAERNATQHDWTEMQRKKQPKKIERERMNGKKSKKMSKNCSANKLFYRQSSFTISLFQDSITKRKMHMLFFFRLLYDQKCNVFCCIFWHEHNHLDLWAFCWLGFWRCCCCCFG